MRLIFLLALLLFSAPELRAEERWYIFSIGGTPVGYVSEVADGGRTRTTMFARLTRLGKSIEMRFETTTVEDGNGDLQSLAYEAVLSKQPMRLDVAVEGDRIRLTAPQAPPRVVDRGRERLLGPGAVTRLTATQLKTIGARIDYAVFSPELQRVAKVARLVMATNERIACGNALATRIEETLEGLPAPRTVWIDTGGTTVADSITGPFGPMTTCRATKAAAMAANGTLPADLYERTLARSNIRFVDAAALDRVVLRIRPRQANLKLPSFEAHNQRVPEAGVVEITRVRRQLVAHAAPVNREFLEPNALVESTHADIVRIGKELTRGSAYDTALALTKWTAENLSIDAGIVMAPASELIRDRKATCMGYATLLAALGRAAGLPSRIVMGYVYYGGIWGGHAWTEFHVDGQWLPFDAAVYSPGIASAARLSVGASSLADGGGSLTGPLTALFGNVDVATTEYEIDGRVRRVMADERPFRITGNTYVNRGLGVKIRTDGWTVERADSTWPSTLVVAFRRADTTIELHQRPRYPERAGLPDAEAIFASRDGATVWLWTARGTGSEAALRDFLTRVERVE